MQWCPRTLELEEMSACIDTPHTDPSDMPILASNWPIKIAYGMPMSSIMDAALWVIQSVIPASMLCNLSDPYAFSTAPESFPVCPGNNAIFSIMSIAGNIGG